MVATEPLDYGSLPCKMTILNTQDNIFTFFPGLSSSAILPGGTLSSYVSGALIRVNQTQWFIIPIVNAPTLMTFLNDYLSFYGEPITFGG